MRFDEKNRINTKKINGKTEGKKPLNRPGLRGPSEKVSFHLGDNPTTGHRSVGPPPRCHRGSRQTRSEGRHTQQHGHTAVTDYWFHSRTNVAVFLVICDNYCSGRRFNIALYIFFLIKHYQF